MYCKDSILEIEILHSQAEALEKTESASVEQIDHDIDKIFEIL